MPDLARIAAACGTTADRIASVAGDAVTLTDGTVHTVAEPKLWGLEDFVAEQPKAKPAPPAA